MNSNVYAKLYQNIPKGSRDRFIFWIWTSAKLRPTTNGIWQSLGLHLVHINTHANFHHNIPLGSRDRAIFTFSEFGARHIFDRWWLSFCNILGYILSISMCMQKFIKNIPNSLRVVSIFRELSWASRTDRGLTSVIIGHTLKVNLQLLCFLLFILF